MSNITDKQSRVALVVSLALGLVGLAAWLYQLSQGLQVTGLNNTLIWGLTIAVFFAIIAGGAGLLALCGLSEFLGFMTSEQRSRGIAFAIAAMIAGGILVIWDLGHPSQFFYLMTSFNFTSFSVLDFWFLSACIVVAVVYLIAASSGKPHRIIGAVALLLSVGIIVVEGILLANNSSHHLWASSMNVISFLSGAFLGGSALLAAIAPSRKRLFVVALIISALVTLAEVGTALVAGTDTARHTMQLVVAGPFAAYFYFQIIVGIIVSLVLALRTNRLGLAALTAILGLAAEKLWLLLAGETEIWGQAHHIGPLQVVQQFSYWPSLVEIGLTVGAIGIGVFLFLLLSRVVLRRPAVVVE
ncbi:MAG: polysulfide reductase NrfD [Coriobacteriales bacterium]|jgi:molybdopterin-containing oxidoreductase family membrane subunit|nr:polysulfide reductase NrfD [Coriobacteriales bacterium]